MCFSRAAWCGTIGGWALEIGAETSAPEVARITFRDCDIVRTEEIALDVQHSDRAVVKDVLFENIRFEVDEVNYAPRIQKSREGQYTGSTNYCPRFLVLVVVKTGNSHDQERGTMENVVVRNCSITGKPLPKSQLRGYDAEHGIRGVTIENLRINGRVVRSLKEAAIQVGPHVRDVSVESR